MFLTKQNRGFIHIARTGGTYVRQSCRPQIRHEPRPRHGAQPGAEQYPGTEWAAVIRHPVDRFRSLWQQHVRNRDRMRDRHRPGEVGVGLGWVPEPVLMSWHTWMDWYRNSAVQLDHQSQRNHERGLWNTQVSRITSGTHLFLYDTQLADCVRWLGGSPGAHRVNHSEPFTADITPLQRSMIEQRYAHNMSLYERMQSLAGKSATTSGFRITRLDNY